MSWQFNLDAPPGQMIQWAESGPVDSATETMLLAGPAPGPPPDYEFEPPPVLRFGAGDPFATAASPADLTAELRQRLARHRDRLDQLEDELRWLIFAAVQALKQMEAESP